MDEQQAVLEFFAKQENLPLALSVADQTDEIRARLNSQFWIALQHRLDAHLFSSEWESQVTEDRNAEGVIVGLQCKLRAQQANCLFPMMEQQYLGGHWRIFFGLMWQIKPAPEQINHPMLAKLKTTLADSGFKNNENFLAWQWTHFHTRRSDFLLKFSADPESLLNEAEAIFLTLLKAPGALITAANDVLKDAPRSMTISLDQLRRKQ